MSRYQCGCVLQAESMARSMNISDKVNVFTRDGVKIDFSSRFKRFSILFKKEWISISKTTLDLLRVVTKPDSDFENLSIRQNGSSIGIMKILDNFLITYKRNTALPSSIVLSASVMGAIEENYDRMMDMLEGGEKSTEVSGPSKKRKFDKVEKGKFFFSIKHKTSLLKNMHLS